MKNTKAIIEGLLFISGDEGLSLEELTNITEKTEDEIKPLIKELYNDYENEDRGIQIEFLGNHFKLTTKIEHKEYYKKLVEEQENSLLGQSALETLAIIAYNAPITRIEIDEIRGVNSSYVIRKLLLKGLIEDIGKADLPGKPRLYNVTSKFLDYFGLGSLEELPKIESNNNDIDNEKSLFESRYKEDSN